LNQKSIIEELIENRTNQRRQESDLDRAQTLMYAGNWEEARALFEKVLEDDPHNRDAAAAIRLIDHKYNVPVPRTEPVPAPVPEPAPVYARPSAAVSRDKPTELTQSLEDRFEAIRRKMAEREIK